MYKRRVWVAFGVYACLLCAGICVPARGEWMGGILLDSAVDGAYDVSGTVFASGSGFVINAKNKVEPFVLTPPLGKPLTLYGGPQPLPTELQTNPEFDLVGTKFNLVDIRELNLDLLGGQSASFQLDTVSLTTNSSRPFLKNFEIDLVGSLTELRFDQTGMVSLLGGPSSGSYSVNGNLVTTVDAYVFYLLGLLSLPWDHQSVSVPTTLSGQWTSVLGGEFLYLTLDGSVNLDLPISQLSDLSTIVTDIFSLTLSSTLDFAASLHIAFDYDLNFLIYVPEPGSVVLLGIGLAAVGGVAMQRWRARS